MITDATLHERELSIALFDPVTPIARGSAQRPMTPDDLTGFGRCPARWRYGLDPDDFLPACGPSLTEWLTLDPGQAANYFIRRPDTYEAARLVCPKCGSPGPAKTCTKCGTRRKTVIGPRPWSSAAKHCAAWAQKHELENRRIVPAPEYDRAAMGAEQILKDSAIRDLLPSCLRLRTLSGVWEDEASRAGIPVLARASLVPASINSTYQVMAQIVDTRNADPVQWEAQAFSRGYHIAAALALYLYNLAAEAEVRDFFWIVVEKDPPRIVGRRRASMELLAEGRLRLAELLASYAGCLVTSTWPRFEGEGESGFTAWPLVSLQPWMTSGQGAHGGYFAPTVAPTLPGTPTADATQT
jgi:hypothetical protein